MSITNQVESQPDVEFPESAIEIYDHNRVSEHPEIISTATDIANLAAGGFINDPKQMIKYHWNWFALPMSLYPIYYYSRLFFVQISTQLPTAQDDFMPISIALKIRYIGYLAYFLLSFLYRPFIYECRNAEGPVLISSVLEIYYILNRKPEEMNQITMMFILVPIVVVVLCFLRRKPYLRLLLNPWSKDKSELIKLIEDAKKRAGLTDLK